MDVTFNQTCRGLSLCETYDTEFLNVNGSKAPSPAFTFFRPLRGLPSSLVRRTPAVWFVNSIPYYVEKGGGFFLDRHPACSADWHWVSLFVLIGSLLALG